MSKRIGDLLVSEGLLQETQLKKALEAQLIYGAHLGTCLIELGFVQEQQLGAILARVFGVKYARREMLENLPEDVLRTLPARIVERYKVIPFDLESGLLHVAMVDPKDLHALDEIRFASGSRIEPWVSPEIRLLSAMERYYAIPRQQRFIGLYRHEEENPALATMAAAAGASSHPSAGLADGAGRTRMPGARHTPEEALSLLSDGYCLAETEERVVNLTLDELRRTMPRCLFFAVRGTEASVQEARGFESHQGRLRRLSFPVTKERVFSLLLEKGYYRGPVPEDPRYSAFFEKMQSVRPDEILLWPVYCHGRLVAIVYGDGGNGRRIAGETGFYERLVAKLSLTLGLILLKRKIRNA